MPSSSIISSDAAATGFDMEAMRKMVSVFMGLVFSASMKPWALRCTILPLMATSVTPPVISPAVIVRSMNWSMRVARSAESDAAVATSGTTNAASAASAKTVDLTRRELEVFM